jgi:hypothetical protein
MPARTARLGISYDSRSGLHRWDSSLRFGMTIVGVARPFILVCTVSECTNVWHRLPSPCMTAWKGCHGRASPPAIDAKKGEEAGSDARPTALEFQGALSETGTRKRWRPVNWRQRPSLPS